MRNVFSMTQSDTMDTMPANSVKLLGDSQQACIPSLIRYPRRLPHSSLSPHPKLLPAALANAPARYCHYITECCLRPEKSKIIYSNAPIACLFFGIPWNSNQDTIFITGNCALNTQGLRPFVLTISDGKWSNPFIC